MTCHGREGSRCGSACTPRCSCTREDAEQLYGEVLEQIENADRLGFDCYASIEPFFFPKFSISAHPTALFAAARSGPAIRFRTMLHVLPYHNPMVLAWRSPSTDILTGGRTMGGRARARLDPGEGRRPLDEHARPRYEEAADLLLTALDQRAVLAPRASTSRSTTRNRAVSDARLPGLRRRHLRPDVRARGRARMGCRRATAPAVQGARAAARPLPREVRRARDEPDIVWIHACHLDDDRETAMREARDWVTSSSTATARRSSNTTSRRRTR